MCLLRETFLPGSQVCRMSSTRDRCPPKLKPPHQDGLDSLHSLTSVAAASAQNGRVGVKFTGPEAHPSEGHDGIDLTRDLNEILEAFDREDVDMSKVLLVSRARSPKPTNLFLHQGLCNRLNVYKP